MLDGKLCDFSCYRTKHELWCFLVLPRCEFLLTPLRLETAQSRTRRPPDASGVRPLGRRVRVGSGGAVGIEGQVQASGSPLANSTVTLWQASARALRSK